MKLGLNIGCGMKHLKSDSVDWLNADLRVDVGADEIVDLTARWPWPADHFDYLMADNVLEHFDSRDAIHVLNEIGRVLKPFGEATIIVPHALSQGAYQDPTHKSFWVPRSCLYWNQKDTPHGGEAVGITANLLRSGVRVYGDPATEQFIEFRVYKDPR